jgi:hypothetical protein
MAKRIASVEPASELWVLVAAWVRQIADRALVDLYDRNGRSTDAARARTLQSADSESAQKTRSDFEAAQSRLDTSDLSTLVRRYGLTNEELRAYERGGPLPPATRMKIDTMTREVDALEGPLVEKALKAMPD